MKKILPVFLAASMLLSACGGKTSSLVAETSSAAEETERETETPTEAEESTEAESADQSEKMTKKTDVLLSDDLYSFQIMINDNVYELPMTYEEFTAYGWIYGDDPSAELTAGRYTSSEVFTNGKLKCYAGIANFDVNTKKISECYIISLKFETSMLKDADAVVTLPGGISLGGNFDEAIALYGMPTSDYDNETTRRSATYSLSSNEKIEIGSVYEDRDVIGSIEVRKLVQPDDFVAGSVSTDIPEIVGKYNAPAALSDDFGDFIVEYGGDFYQLPAPVSVFVSNGWSIVEDASEATIAGRDSSWVTMMKDNQKLKVIVSNYDENATAIQNGFVTNLIGDIYTNKTSIIITNNITIGMTRTELESALSDVEYTTDESGSMSTSYKISPAGSLMNDYDISVSKETDQVTRIDVKNEPKYAEYVNR